MKRILIAILVALLGIGLATPAFSNTLSLQEMITVKEIQYPYYSVSWRKETLFRELTFSFCPEAVRYQRQGTQLYIILGTFSTQVAIEEAPRELTLKPKKIMVDVTLILKLRFGREEDLENFLEALKEITQKELRGKVVCKAYPEVKVDIARVFRTNLQYFATGILYLKGL